MPNYFHDIIKLVNLVWYHSSMLKSWIVAAMAVTIITCSAPVFCQNEKAPVESNLYFVALKSALESSYKTYSKINPDRDFAKVIVETNDLVEDFPVEFGPIRVEYLDYTSLRNRYKVKKEQFPINVIRPLRNEGNKLIISVMDYWISFPKKNNVMYSLEGGATVYFAFDPQLKQFVVEKTDLWGI